MTIDKYDKESLSDFCDFIQKWDKDFLNGYDKPQHKYNRRFEDMSISNIIDDEKKTLFSSEKDYLIAKRISDLSDMYHHRYDDSLMDIFDAVEERSGIVDDTDSPEGIEKSFYKAANRAKKEKEKIYELYGADVGRGDIDPIKQEFKEEIQGKDLDWDGMMEYVSEFRPELWSAISDKLIKDVQVPLSELGQDIWDDPFDYDKIDKPAQLHYDVTLLDTNYRRSEILEPFIEDQRRMCNTWKEKGIIE